MPGLVGSGTSCIYLRTNSDLCHLQHKLTGFYNRDEKWLQHGTDWAFKLSSLHFVFKELKHLSKATIQNNQLENKRRKD
jgi:hypothetical protein